MTQPLKIGIIVYILTLFALVYKYMIGKKAR
jgi:hypothetical protein